MSKKWFRHVLPGVDFVPGGLDCMRPAWALADMLARAQDRRVHCAWLLDPDDIDLDMASEDREMNAALASFDLEPDCITSEGYAEVFNALQSSITRSQRNRAPRS